MKKLEFVALALLVDIVGLVLGIRLGLPQFGTIALSAAPAMLVAFPFMKRWMPKVTFKQWLFTVGLCWLVAWPFYVAFAKLVGG
jgi:hypothetical protein